MRRFAVIVASGVVLSGCALKGDVRRVEREVQALREETARADSAQAAQLDQVLAFQQRALDSLVTLQRRLTAFQGELRSELTEVQRQLVQVGELAGVSQQRLTEMRAQLDSRLQLERVPGAGGEAGGGDIGVRELFDLSLQQLRRGSPQTARAGFRKLIEDFPDHPLAADALFFIGETWEEQSPDSAGTAYELVLRRAPTSRHAPTALYRLGVLAERRGDERAAELYFQRVVQQYPQSEEAALARTKLRPDR